MTKPIQGQSLHPASVEESLMADLFFGTPTELLTGSPISQTGDDLTSQGDRTE